MPPLTEDIVVGFFAGGGFFLIGCLTWILSTRRKAFIRTFCPPSMLYDNGRKILRDVSFRRGARSMALLQMGLGILFALISLGAWLW